MADKIIQKYQTSTCEQLWVKKSEKTSPGPEEQKAIAFLKKRSSDAHCLQEQSCTTNRQQNV